MGQCLGREVTGGRRTIYYYYTQPPPDAQNVLARSRVGNLEVGDIQANGIGPQRLDVR